MLYNKQNRSYSERFCCLLDTYDVIWIMRFLYEPNDALRANKALQFL